MLTIVLRNPLFGDVNLSETADPGKCFYSGYGILFDVCETLFIAKWWVQ